MSGGGGGVWMHWKCIYKTYVQNLWNVFRSLARDKEKLKSKINIKKARGMPCEENTVKQRSATKHLYVQKKHSLSISKHTEIYTWEYLKIKKACIV